MMYSIHRELRAYNERMSGRAILTGAFLLSLSTTWAQTGSVHIHVTDTNGSPIHGATVALLDGLNRTIDTSTTNNAGDVLWPRLAFGEWRFVVVATGFAADAFALNVCESREQTIRTRLPVAPPEQDLNRITVEAEATLLKIPLMPYCDVLDLPQSAKLKKRN